jgi:hypothetical protein
MFAPGDPPRRLFVDFLAYVAFGVARPPATRHDPVAYAEALHLRRVRGTHHLRGMLACWELLLNQCSAENLIEVVQTVAKMKMLD